MKQSQSRLTRRAFAAGLAARPLAAAAPGLAAGCIRAILAALDKMPPGPALLNSYVVQPGAADFDLTQANAAYVYDNALAGLALLAANQRAAASRLGDALAIAQANDRFYRDGRLRNAYQAGPMAMPAKLPGWWDAKAGHWAEDPYQAGSQTGPLAWAMRLWAALGNRPPAWRAATWLNTQLRANHAVHGGYYGGFYGFEPAPLKLTWQSTEQNTDLFRAFSALGQPAAAAYAAAFVRAMFDPGTQTFGAGLSPSGARNPLLAADAGIWPYLAGLANAASARAAIAALRRGGGIGFSAASATEWLEGTAFAALALARMRDARADDFFAAIAAQRAPGGYIYATIAPSLATGLQVGPALIQGQTPEDFNYFRRPALSATAWAALASMSFNPLA